MARRLSVARSGTWGAIKRAHTHTCAHAHTHARTRTHTHTHTHTHTLCERNQRTDDQCGRAQQAVKRTHTRTHTNTLPRLVRTTGKALKMTETMPPVVLTRALFAGTLKRHKQWHYLSPRSIHDDLHAWTARHVSPRGKTTIGIPKIPLPTPIQRKRERCPHRAHRVVHYARTAQAFLATLFSIFQVFFRVARTQWPKGYAYNNGGLPSSLLTKGACSCPHPLPGEGRRKRKKKM